MSRIRIRLKRAALLVIVSTGCGCFAVGQVGPPDGSAGTGGGVGGTDGIGGSAGTGGAIEAGTGASTGSGGTSGVGGASGVGGTTGVGGASGGGGASGTGGGPGIECLPLPEAYETVVGGPSSPPWSGTAWMSTEIIRDTDPSAFVGLSYTGQANRVMYDRRTGDWETYYAHLFDARFGQAVRVEIQVNPEFSAAEAEAEATKYAEIIGRMPALLFAELYTVWIHDGDEDLGGGNQNLLLHTDRAQRRILAGSFEEVMLHELGHTSIDPHHRDAPLWRAAQAADRTAISDYAEDEPDREDLAETLVPYLAARFRSERIGAQTTALILETIPNRIKYFDCLGLSMDVAP